MIQNHVDLLSGKVHAVPTRAKAADAAAIIRDICLRSGDGFPDVLVVDHDSKFTSKVFWAFVRSMGSSLIVGSAYHKNTNAKVEPTASSATHCAPSPTAARTTGTATCRSPSSPSTTRRRRLAAT